ncbi:MAG: hypothetical protein NTV97_00515, partial [Alphaproteobacteria bacterium]|nr:hypothetical protein [Alphaproteobacteria bacterium]
HGNVHGVVDAAEQDLGLAAHRGLEPERGIGVERGLHGVVTIGDGTLPDILTDGDAEKTYVQFGPGEAYSKRLLVLSMRPRSLTEAEIVACDDDPRMYDPLPEEFVAPPGVGTDPLEVHIAADVPNGNLRTIADAAGYSGLRAQPVTIILDSGVTAYSNDPAIPALVRGSWPFGYKPTFINRGLVEGEGGRGGGPGSPPQAGGSALDALSGPLGVDNSAGVLRGGGGGGGAGQTVQDVRDGSVAGGGGGGGGQGRTGGAAGDGYTPATVPGNAGTAGSHSAAGGGGAGVVASVLSGPGGSGGAFGAAGAAGGGVAIDPNDGSFFLDVQAAQAGGPAGKAANGNGNITWIGSTGTRTGPVT